MALFKDLFNTAAGLPPEWDALTSQVLGRITPQSELAGIAADSQRARSRGWKERGNVDFAFNCIQAAHEEPATNWVSPVARAKVAIKGFRFGS